MKRVTKSWCSEMRESLGSFLSLEESHALGGISRICGRLIQVVIMYRTKLRRKKPAGGYS
jgi:hypothetical protein